MLPAFRQRRELRERLQAGAPGSREFSKTLVHRREQRLNGRGIVRIPHVAKRVKRSTIGLERFGVSGLRRLDHAKHPPATGGELPKALGVSDATRPLKAPRGRVWLAAVVLSDRQVKLRQHNERGPNARKVLPRALEMDSRTRGIIRLVSAPAFHVRVDAGREPCRL